MSSKPAGQHSDPHTGQHTGQHTGLGRALSLEIVRVTEGAAVAAARLRGRGAEKMSDQAAVDAMRRELSGLAIDGTVVIGEGEMDEAPMLFIGEKVGTGSGPKVDPPIIGHGPQRWPFRFCEYIITVAGSGPM